MGVHLTGLHPIGAYISQNVHLRCLYLMGAALSQARISLACIFEAAVPKPALPELCPLSISRPIVVPGYFSMLRYRQSPQASPAQLVVAWSRGRGVGLGGAALALGVRRLPPCI